MSTLPAALAPPIPPMLAKVADALPGDGDFLFEPKWDGFRAIVFRTAQGVFIQSRDLRPLDRYFPELAKALLERLPRGCVIDGEIVVTTRAGWTSTRCSSACTRPRRGSRGSRRRRRPPSSRSTCWRPGAATPRRCRRPNGARGSSSS